MTNAIHPARVRFAPSPTGRLHIGGARTALYNYLLAKQTGGQFILRLEDTDSKRLDPAAEGEIYDSLKWLGLTWDEGPMIGGEYGPYRQSERKQIYNELIQELIERGHAYYCFCSQERLVKLRQEQKKRKEPPHYDGLCRKLPNEEAESWVQGGESHVVRFKTPKEGTTTAIDLLRDPIQFQNNTLDDFILIKSDGMPVYHFAAIADDHLMQITHVFRGSEWLPTFPLHVLIYQAFEWQQPVWAHLSVLLNPTGKGKLSKRYAADPKKGAKSVYVLDLQEMGYLPQAVNNWMALMGWSYDDHSELFAMPELIKAFSLEKLHPSPAAVNFSKLDHFNGLYLRNLSILELTERIQPYFEKAGYNADSDSLLPIAALVQKRIRTLADAVEIAGFFFEESINPPPVDLIGKGMTAVESALAAEMAHKRIGLLDLAEHDAVETDLRKLAEELSLKAGQLFGILRLAITGQKVSPPLIATMAIVGKSLVLSRISEAIQKLKQLDHSK